jgi:hypothetical protein
MPDLEDTSKTFLSDCPFGVYLIACRFEFLEEAMGTAKVSNTHSISYHGFDEEVRDMSATDVLRFARFVQERES